MSKLIRLSRAYLEEEEKQAICDVLEDGYLGMGQQVMLFEKELEAFFSNNVYVACVNTGTSALHLALKACGIGEGDKVIIPSITYVASFQATSAAGATPVPCDIDLTTGCMDIEDVRKKIDSSTKALMYVHYAGSIGPREEIFKLAQEFNLRVIEDAAHSFGGFEKKERIGEKGDITCFSFDGIKNITCGEGGAIVSKDKEIIDKVCDLRLLGVKKDTQKRYAGKRSWDFEVEEQGWRYHMSNINAALGRTQLKKIDYFGNLKRQLVQFYREALASCPIDFLKLELNTTIPHIFPVLIRNQQRDALQSFLMENFIETGIHYKPNHMLKKFFGEGCEQAEIFGNRTLSLPLHCNLTEVEIQKVCKVIKEFFKV